MITQVELKIDNLAHTKIPLPSESFTLKSFQNDPKTTTLVVEPLKDACHL